VLTFSTHCSFGDCNEFNDFEYVAYLRSEIGLLLEFLTSAVVIRFWTIKFAIYCRPRCVFAWCNDGWSSNL